MAGQRASLKTADLLRKVREGRSYRNETREAARRRRDGARPAASASVALARQVALVVGNSTYAHIGRLPNPENDAVDMAVELRRIGFEVTTELDVDRGDLTEALRAFTRRSAGADVSLAFYAGHRLEMDGINYLVPVDARLERDVDVRYEKVTPDDLPVATVILDACRNNPLARPMQRTVASRSVSGGSFGPLDPGGRRRTEAARQPSVTSIRPPKFRASADPAR